MTRIHHQEKEQFQKLFENEYIDRFEDRFKVLGAFLQTEHHVTAGELVQLLNEDGNHFDLEFVRDTLQLMSRFGFAQINRFENGVVHFEHRHLGQHHDHMVCTRCKKIIEFKDEKIESQQIRIAEAHGFHLLQHKMEIYGICAECSQNREKLMPLMMAKPGERLIIKGFGGGFNARMRLMTMGLRVGDEIEVVTNHRRGQVVIAVAQKRYIVGRGLAQQIRVQAIKD